MRFYTIIQNGKEEIAVAYQQPDRSLSATHKQQNVAYPLRKLGYDFADMNDLIRRISKEQLDELRAMQDRDLSAHSVFLDEQIVEAPICRPLQDVICLGINYGDHAIEAGKFSNEAFGGDRPYTIYFSKRVNKATAPGENIPDYAGLVDSLDYEVELGVILAADAKDVAVEEAMDYVFGYTIINDISARNLQTRHKQWYRGKSLDGFTPMGPCIVTADEIGNPHDLQIRCYVNGELRQDGNTKYMMQTVAGAIAELSEGMTLQAGTIIATGTPAGVGMGMEPPCFLKKGDVITCEIEKIGVLENTIVGC